MVQKQWRTARSDKAHINGSAFVDQYFLTERTVNRQFRRYGNFNSALFLVNGLSGHVHSAMQKFDRSLALLFRNINCFLNHILDHLHFRMIFSVDFYLDLNRSAFFNF